MQEKLKLYFKNLNICGCMKMIDFNCLELDVSYKVTKLYHFIGTRNMECTVCGQLRHAELMKLLENHKIF